MINSYEEVSKKKLKNRLFMKHPTHNVHHCIFSRIFHNAKHENCREFWVMARSPTLL